MSWIRIQLKNQNTVNIPIDQFLSMTDEEYDDLMNSDYGYYIDNVNEEGVSEENSYFDDLDIDYSDE